MSRFAIGLLALLAASAGAQAQILLHANLTNAQEVPPTVPMTSTGAPRPASFGTADFVINAAMTSMTFTATVFNIDFTGSQTADTFDNLTAAHIHAPAPPGMSTGVVWGFFGMPFNDNNPNDMTKTNFATGVGGMMTGKWDAPEGNAGTTFALQLNNLLNGQAYINFHTTQFAGGEIRGQILQVAAIPEPETCALMLAGLGALGAWVRRARRDPNTGA